MLLSSVYYTGNFTVFKGTLSALQAWNASASPARRRKGGLPKQGRQSNGDSHTLTSSGLLCSLTSFSEWFWGRGNVRVGTVLTTPNAEKKKKDGKN